MALSFYMYRIRQIHTSNACLNIIHITLCYNKEVPAGVVQGPSRLLHSINILYMTCVYTRVNQHQGSVKLAAPAMPQRRHSWFKHLLPIVFWLTVLSRWRGLTHAVKGTQPFTLQSRASRVCIQHERRP